MKIGLVMAVYNGMDYLEKCLAPWIEYRDKNKNLLISVVDSRFVGFDGETQNSNDGTVQFLIEKINAGKIDFFQALLKNHTEKDARNAALSPLLNIQCDYIISWGVDEIATLEQIEYLISYIERNPEIFVFHIHYKNLFNDASHYIDDGFCPRRIWKTDGDKYKLEEFVMDDDMSFFDKINKASIPDKFLPMIRIPKARLFVSHHSWNNFDRNVKKIEYQQKRWGIHGCSYRINNRKHCIETNPDYYKKIGQPPPEIKEV
jgi:hypothetical protein